MIGMIFILYFVMFLIGATIISGYFAFDGDVPFKSKQFIRRISIFIFCVLFLYLIVTTVDNETKSLTIIKRKTVSPSNKMINGIIIQEVNINDDVTVNLTETFGVFFPEGTNIKIEYKESKTKLIDFSNPNYIWRTVSYEIILPDGSIFEK